MTSRPSILLLSAVVFMLAGCSDGRPPVYPVSGRVQFLGGVPVRHGKVELESIEHGLTATGTIQHDGSFVLGTYTADDGAVAGSHRAIVVQIVVADGSFLHTVDHGRPVPVRYADYGSSPLSVTVSATHANELVIELE
ncbi:MAG: carboxypeptidase regulatory-like domain-containing protein [Planctomycetaceae bacterium]|nr:carboxypeptidase regulatory-like domain-containing protein [Planctomycetaceae bacterium]